VPVWSPTARNAQARGRTRRPNSCLQVCAHCAQKSRFHSITELRSAAAQDFGEPRSSPSHRRSVRPRRPPYSRDSVGTEITGDALVRQPGDFGVRKNVLANFCVWSVAQKTNLSHFRRGSSPRNGTGPFPSASSVVIQQLVRSRTSSRNGTPADSESPSAA
jgi:hypothetical protein